MDPEDNCAFWILANCKTCIPGFPRNFPGGRGFGRNRPIDGWCVRFEWFEKIARVGIGALRQRGPDAPER